MRGLINISRMADIQIYEQKGTCHTVVVCKVWIASHLSTCPQMVLRTYICGIVGWSRYKKTAISGKFGDVRNKRAVHESIVDWMGFIARVFRKAGCGQAWKLFLIFKLTL